MCNNMRTIASCASLGNVRVRVRIMCIIRIHKGGMRRVLVVLLTIRWHRNTYYRLVLLVLMVVY